MFGSEGICWSTRSSRYLYRDHDNGCTLLQTHRRPIRLADKSRRLTASTLSSLISQPIIAMPKVAGVKPESTSSRSSTEPSPSKKRKIRVTYCPACPGASG